MKQQPDVYLNMTSINVRIPQIETTAPVDFDQRMELRRLLTEVEHKLPPEEAQRLQSMLWGGYEERQLKAKVEELAQAFEAIVQTLTYQQADNHARELAEAMVKLTEIKNAGS